LLRSEVREMNAIRLEMKEMKSALAELQRSDFPPLRQSDFPPLRTVSEGGSVAASLGFQHSTAAPMIGNQVAAADIVREAVKTGALQRQRVKTKAVVGSKTSSRVKPVTTKRCVDIFLSRLQPDTTSEDVEQLTNEALSSVSEADLSHVSITAERLPSKHEFYASYHVAVTVNSDSFAHFIEILMTGDSWPSGILVRRFFQKRERHE